MTRDSLIYVAGHKGMVGSAIVRRLMTLGYRNLVLAEHKELDLCSQADTDRFFKKEKPEFVFLAAAKVGGIMANAEHPAEFIHDNLMIQTNVISAAYKYGAKKLLFLGSSCIYPKFAPQPIRESYLLEGELEPTNEMYAIAKIAGLKMIDAFRKQYGFSGISLMPTNLYGPEDNFDLQSSHVLPAMIRKFHDAKKNKYPEVILWGTGKPKREFLHVDDLARAACFLMKRYDEPGWLNIGTGKDVSIKELASIISKTVGYEGKIIFDAIRPDGTPRKLLNVNKVKALGWKAQIPLEEGIENTYEWYKKNC